MTKLIELGEVQAKHVIFRALGDSSTGRYVASAQKTDFLERIELWPNLDTKCVGFHCEDSDGKFYGFANVDCFDPPVYIVRARNMEDAHECFCDEFVHAVQIDEPDLSDYDEENLNYNSNGVPIDTEQLQMFEVVIDFVVC